MKARFKHWAFLGSFGLFGLIEVCAMGVLQWVA